MPDEGTNNGTGETGGADVNAELEKEKRERAKAYELLRKRDARDQATQSELSTMRETIRELQARLDKSQTAPATSTTTSANITADDPEPDIDNEPTKWMKWDSRRRDREAGLLRQQTEMEALNSFGLASEATARSQYPDYEQAKDYLKSDYREELELTGELDEAAMRVADLMRNDRSGNMRTEISRRMGEKSLTEFDAIKDWCFDAAYEARRVETVKAQRRKGGNPAAKQYELAKRRGYKGAAQNGSQQQNGAQANATDDALKEFERRRNLQRGSQTTGDVAGSESTEDRAYTRAELERLRTENPREYHRAIRDLANRADEKGSNTIQDIITR